MCVWGGGVRRSESERKKRRKRKKKECACGEGGGGADQSLDRLAINQNHSL